TKQTFVSDLQIFPLIFLSYRWIYRSSHLPRRRSLFFSVKCI
ncbi:unnamed protein product, partial [Brassica oleracea]